MGGEHQVLLGPGTGHLLEDPQAQVRAALPVGRGQREGPLADPQGHQQQGEQHTAGPHIDPLDRRQTSSQHSTRAVNSRSSYYLLSLVCVRMQKTRKVPGNANMSQK